MSKCLGGWERDRQAVGWPNGRGRPANVKDVALWALEGWEVRPPPPIEKKLGKLKLIGLHKETPMHAYSLCGVYSTCSVQLEPIIQHFFKTFF